MSLIDWIFVILGSLAMLLSSSLLGYLQYRRAGLLPSKMREDDPVKGYINVRPWRRANDGTPIFGYQPKASLAPQQERHTHHERGSREYTDLL